MLEPLAPPCAKRRGHKLLQLKVRALVTKPGWDAKRWGPWKVSRAKRGGVVVYGECRTGRPVPLGPNTKGNGSTATATSAPGQPLAQETVTDVENKGKKEM